VNKDKSEAREKKKNRELILFLQTWTIKSAQHLMKKNKKKSSRKKYIRGNDKADAENKEESVLGG
jgi:hypothetical protein